MKVLGSEVLDYVVDETVQIHGGMGYSAETRAELAYRDARINRIFEGTNEINRMLTVDMILKKAMKGEIDLMTPAMAISAELTGVPDMSLPASDMFEKQLDYVRNFKKAILMVAGSAAQKLMMSLGKEQEILMSIADMAIWAYTAESTVLRVQKLRKLRGTDADLSVQEAIMRVYTYEASEWIHSAGKEALLAFAEGDELKMMLMGMKRFAKTEDFNTKEARQLIAMHLINKNSYSL
jgi:alkylation response protein AidB-like acyl-CoA dehydrogenase